MCFSDISFTKLGLMDNSNTKSLQSPVRYIRAFVMQWLHQPVVCSVSAPTFSIGSVCWLFETVGAFDNTNTKITSITEKNCTDCLVETRLISILTTPSCLFCVFPFFPVDLFFWHIRQISLCFLSMDVALGCRPQMRTWIGHLICKLTQHY